MIRQILLFPRSQDQLIQVNHRGIIKAPLKEVVCDETGGPGGSLARVNDGLFTIRQQQHVLPVPEFHPAVNQGKGRAIGVIHNEHEFRAFDPGHSAARDDPDASGLVAMEKGNDSPRKVQARLRLGRIRRQYLKLG